jgi:hypothetical protein
MQTLTIELQEGFRDDAVVIRVNGSDIMHEDHVKTRTQIGFAAAATAMVPEGTATLDVTLPAAGTSGNFAADVQGPTWVGVSLDDTRVPHFKLSQTPFGYV